MMMSFFFFVLLYFQIGMLFILNINIYYHSVKIIFFFFTTWNTRCMPWGGCICFLLVKNFCCCCSSSFFFLLSLPVVLVVLLCHHVVLPSYYYFRYIVVCIYYYFIYVHQVVVIKYQRLCDKTQDTNRNSNLKALRNSKMASLDGLSEYEILRLQNIERNQSKLKKLGLTELRNGMKTNVKKRVKKKPASRKRQISSIPARNPNA